MYTFLQLSTLSHALSDPARIEILFYLHHYAPLYQKEICSITGWTQAKTNRHFLMLAKLGVIILHSPTGNQNMKLSEIKEEFRAFFDSYFALLSKEDVIILKNRYKENNVKI